MGVENENPTRQAARRPCAVAEQSEEITEDVVKAEIIRCEPVATI